MNGKFKTIILGFVSALMLPFLISNNYKENIAEETIQAKEVPFTLYESNKDNKYAVSDEYLTESMTFGSKKAGSLVVEGIINTESTFRGCPAFGMDGIAYFTYTFNTEYLTNPNEEWHFMSDSGKTVNGNQLTGKIEKGALLIEKSFDGVVWNYAFNPQVDFYNSWQDGSVPICSVSGSDIAQGVYYRFTFAYLMAKQTGKNTFLFWSDPVYDKRWCVELYQVFLLNNKAVASLHDLNSNINTDLLENEDIDVNLVQKGETLIDNSTTIAGFSIDKVGINNLITVSKNGEEPIVVNDGQEFTDDGRYVITTTTLLGDKETRTIFVFKGGDDYGYSTYFSSQFPIVGERMFRFNDYPTFSSDSVLKIKSVSENVPAVTGQVINVKTKAITEIEGGNRSEQVYHFEPGVYAAFLYSGNQETGSFFEYTFIFIISNEEPGPFYNEYQLLASNRLCDLKTKHYEVAYQTNMGGFIFVCFSIDSYKDAYDYAYEIEKRFVEKTSSGDLLYKSVENPNSKIKYYDNYELVKAMNFYAKKNVEISYFNASEPFTYETYDDDLLESLESLNLSQSIKVFPSNLEKERIVGRAPYLNGYQFVSVADYDSVKVQAYCHRNGRTYDLVYNKDVSEQLNVSSKYTIIETNSHGSTNEYDAIYVCENQTKTFWELHNGENTTETTLSIYDFSSDTKELTADYATIVQTEDAFDNNSIVVISAPNVYSYEITCLVSELEGITFYKQGDYYLKFIDRTNNIYNIVLHINGNNRYSSIFDVDSGRMSMYELYNKTHNQQIGSGEEIIYSKAELLELIDSYIDSSLYSSVSYNNYLLYLERARGVYNNSNSTQADINNSAIELVKSINELVLVANKEKLLELMILFESINTENYTEDSVRVLSEKYNECKRLYNSDSASENDISVAAYEFNSAYKGLVPRGNATSLLQKMEQAAAIDVSKYTPSSISNLNSIYLAAQKTLEDKNATQEDMLNMIDLLDNAIGSLILISDFSKLKTLLIYVQNIDQSQYTVESFEKVYAVYGVCLSVYKDLDSTQTRIDSAYSKLLSAINSLIEAGDTSELDKNITYIRGIDPMLYDKESVERLNELYNNALSLVSNRESQENLDALNTQISEFLSGLTVRKCKQELFDALKAFFDLSKDNLSKEDLNKYKEIYDDALSIYNRLDSSDDEVESAINSLKTIMTEINKNSDSSSNRVIINKLPIAFYIIAGIILLIWLIAAIGIYANNSNSGLAIFIYAILFIALAVAIMLFVPLEWYFVAMILGGVELVLSIIFYFIG